MLDEGYQANNHRKCLLGITLGDGRVTNVDPFAQNELDFLLHVRVVSRKAAIRQNVDADKIGLNHTEILLRNRGAWGTAVIQPAKMGNVRVKKWMGYVSPMPTAVSESKHKLMNAPVGMSELMGPIRFSL